MALAILIVLFVIIVIVSRIQLKEKEYAELYEHALVIKSGLWNFDFESSLNYLQLAARLNSYKLLTVYSNDNRMLIQVKGSEYGSLDQFLAKIGLLPEEFMQTDVLYDDVTIGRIEVVNYTSNIYFYLYLLLVMSLILLASKFFIRNLQAMETLESRVLERTKELQVVNEQLSLGEKRYREIYNAPNEAIFMHDADTGRILDVNNGMLEMYGYTYREALNVDVGDLSSNEYPYTMEEAGKKIQKTISQGPQIFDWRARKKDFTLFWVEVATKHTEFSGKGYVIAVVRDVNDRKQTEAALAEEKERLAVTLRSIGDGVITTDVNGNITMLNKVAEDLTGWSQEDAQGKHLTAVFHIINDQSRERSDDPASKVLSTGAIIELSEHTVLIARDGTERTVADSGAPIKDRDSQIIGVILVFRDVTEKNQMELEIIKGRKLESIGILAGGIAHDFNNILAAVLGNINLALTHTDEKDGNYKLLIEAEKASLRARDLTQQLLTFSKGGSPVIELADITEIIKDSASFILRGSNVRCDYQFAKDLWPAQIDSSQISEVVQNIVLNASQAMPSGGTITIIAKNMKSENQKKVNLDPGDYIELTIRDDGIGIPLSLIDNIFDPYFTTKQEGSGLGLAITHSIIKKHHGHIGVVSKRDEGTTFTIYLPAAAEGKTLESIDEDEEQTTVEGGKVLVMDDEEMIRTFTGEMLSMMGFDALFAQTGEEAIELFRSAQEAGDPVDLVIMDLTIPGGMGGKEAVGKIHKLDPNAKVIVTSGYSNDPIMADCQKFGFCATLIKPFQLKDLEKAINKALASPTA